MDLPSSGAIKNVTTGRHNPCMCTVGPLQCPPCQCKCTTRLYSDQGVNSNGEPAPFCPWDSNFSQFQTPDRLIDLGGKQRICVDAILFGYDLLFERNLLFGKARWLGVSNQQDPADAMVFQEILWKHKPDVVIELGTNTVSCRPSADCMTFTCFSCQVMVDPQWLELLIECVATDFVLGLLPFLWCFIFR